MAQALYRKYRSRSFGEVVGQDHVVKTLRSALKHGKLSHAYLFTGPRGIGKTSVARILAYEANEIKYEDGATHLDIIEIDGASNRRIEEIRDLRDKVNILPAGGKYKVYIIDEVHMLTKEAFNALLKTLEEPPQHCIFILATTEAHKLPETIISRTQRFNFKPVSAKNVVGLLQTISKKERIKADNNALELLAEHGEGSIRDSISLLDQLRNANIKLTEDFVRSSLGLPPSKSIDELISHVSSGNSQAVIDLLGELQTVGINPSVIAKDISQRLRFRIAESSNAQWIPVLLKELLEVTTSYSPQERLEIALLESSTNRDLPGTSQGPPAPLTPPRQPKPDKAVPPEKPSKVPRPTATSKFDVAKWNNVIDAVKREQSSLAMALKMAQPTFEGNKLILNFEFPIYLKKANNAHSRKIIADILHKISGKPIIFESKVDKDFFSKKPSVLARVLPTTDEQPIQTISNIFGGGEVLESPIGT